MLLLKLINAYIALQITFRIVLWQHLDDFWPLGGNTKEKWPPDIGTLNLSAQPPAKLMYS